MTNTTNTKEHTEQKEKRKAILLLEDLNARDYFAAKAMQAILSNPDYTEVDDKLANQAYNVADAMLKARAE